MSRSGSSSDFSKGDEQSADEPRSLDWADSVRLEPKPDRSRPLGSRPPLTRAPSNRKRLAFAGAALVAALVAGAGLVGATGSGSGKPDVAASLAEREKRLAELDAETRRRAEALAEIERRSAAKKSELADNTTRVAQLEQRKHALEREIAELIAPVSAPEIERDQARGQQDAVLAPNDPSPPDEDADLRAPRTDIAKTDIAESDVARTDVARGGEAQKDPSRVEQTEVPQTARSATSSQDVAVSGQQEFGGGTRVFIHVRSADPAARERAMAVAAELRRRGVTVAEIRGVRYPVRQDAVRYFYDADRAAISALQEAVRQASTPGGPAPKTQDYRDFRAPPRQGTLELWLS